MDMTQVGNQELIDSVWNKLEGIAADLYAGALYEMANQLDLDASEYMSEEDQRIYDLILKVRDQELEEDEEKDLVKFIKDNRIWESMPTK